MSELAVANKGQARLDSSYADIERRHGAAFVVYNSDKAPSTLYHPQIDDSPEVVSPLEDPQEIRNQYLSRIIDILQGNAKHAIFPVNFIQHFTREEIGAFEDLGLIISGVNGKHSKGGVYIKGAFESSLGMSKIQPKDVSAEVVESLRAVLVSGALKNVAKIKSRAPLTALPEPQKLEGLKRFAMNSMVVAVWQDGEWSQNEVTPDGEFIREIYNDGASTYALEVFEGMRATSDTSQESKFQGELQELEIKNGKITLFRPDENARRFQKSAEAVSMPPISVNQYVQAIITAVQNNREFIPQDGKLYIRPTMIATKGATGLQKALKYIFAVEVSPYGNYLKTASEAQEEDELPGARITAITYNRSTLGRDKAGANYPEMIKHKAFHGAKKNGNFGDVLLITEAGEIQECASNNFFLIDNLGDGNFEIHTSSLEANILPGITRKSLITLLRDPNIQQLLGVNITVHDDKILHEDKIKTATGAFGTGTAVGIGNFKTIRARDGEEVTYNDKESQRLIKKLFNLLQDVCRGKVPGYEHWVMEV